MPRISVLLNYSQIEPNAGFWKQLQKWQQQSCTMTENGGKPQQELPTSFDTKWANRSCALFGMGAGTRAPFLRGLPTTLEGAVAAIPVALDFVLGRRVTRGADVDWLCAVCAALPPEVNAISRIKALLHSSSDFAQLWEGELRPADVKEIVDKLTTAMTS